MKSFVTSQFGHCPLVWMFHSRDLNNKKNYLYERALRITCEDISLISRPVEKANSVSILHRNIQALATVMFKVRNNIALEIMKEIFVPKIVMREHVWHEARKTQGYVWHEAREARQHIRQDAPKAWEHVRHKWREARGHKAREARENVRHESRESREHVRHEARRVREQTPARLLLKIFRFIWNKINSQNYIRFNKFLENLKLLFFFWIPFLRLEMANVYVKNLPEFKSQAVPLLVWLTPYANVMVCINCKVRRNQKNDTLIKCIEYFKPWYKKFILNAYDVQ